MSDVLLLLMFCSSSSGAICVIVLFPYYTHLLLEAMTKKNNDSIALFGTYCTCFTNAHRSNRYEACNSLNN